jgi:hypothetical protein
MSFILAKFYILTRFTRLLPYFAKRVHEKPFKVLIYRQHIDIAKKIFVYICCKIVRRIRDKRDSQSLVREA